MLLSCALTWGVHHLSQLHSYHSSILWCAFLCLPCFLGPMPSSFFIYSVYLSTPSSNFLRKDSCVVKIFKLLLVWKCLPSYFIVWQILEFEVKNYFHSEFWRPYLTVLLSNIYCCVEGSGSTRLPNMWCFRPRPLEPFKIFSVFPVQWDFMMVCLMCVWEGGLWWWIPFFVLIFWRNIYFGDWSSLRKLTYFYYFSPYKILFFFWNFS